MQAVCGLPIVYLIRVFSRHLGFAKRGELGRVKVGEAVAVILHSPQASNVFLIKDGRCHSDLGIPVPKSILIWASPSNMAAVFSVSPVPKSLVIWVPPRLMRVAFRGEMEIGQFRYIKILIWLRGLGE